MKNALIFVGALSVGLMLAAAIGYGVFYLLFCGAARGLFC